MWDQMKCQAGFIINLGLREVGDAEWDRNVVVDLKR